MAKSDAPAFRLILERGPKLVPASAWDAERLESYRTGRVMRFQPVDEADRIGIRKWWAILNRAVKDANTPWTKASQASEAIKLALGIVNLGKTIGGAWMQFPKSLTELDDAELDAAVIDMMDLLHKLTGIDPADWRKEAADVGRDEDEQESLTAAPVDDGSGDGSLAEYPAPTEPAGEDATASDPAPEETAAPPAESSGADTITDADKAFLVDVFKALRAAVGPDVDVLKRQTMIFAESISTKSTLVKAKASVIKRRLQECCGENPTSSVNDIIAYLAGMIGVDEKDLG